MRIAAQIAQGLLILIFLFAGGAKLVASADMVQQFESFGYPLWFMFVTGGIEVLAAVGLLAGFWRPRLAVLGGVLVVATMIGAVSTLLYVGAPAAEMAAPLFIGLAAAWVTRTKWAATK